MGKLVQLQNDEALKTKLERRIRADCGRLQRPVSDFCFCHITLRSPTAFEEGAVSFAHSLFICAWCCGPIDEPHTNLPFLRPSSYFRNMRMLAGIVMIR